MGEAEKRCQGVVVTHGWPGCTGAEGSGSGALGCFHGGDGEIVMSSAKVTPCRWTREKHSDGGRAWTVLEGEPERKPASSTRPRASP